MMNTQNITPEQLTNSVISVPPLARTVEGGISIPENRKIVEHLKNVLLILLHFLGLCDESQEKK